MTSTEKTKISTNLLQKITLISSEHHVIHLN